jgi:hypothetical protein
MLTDRVGCTPGHTYIASHIFMILPFGHCFNNFRVDDAGPYSLLLRNICIAYADIGLLFLMYRLCSVWRVAMSRPVCPTYDLLHELHLILYIPAGLSFCGWHDSCWKMVLVALKATLCPQKGSSLCISLGYGIKI